MPLRRWAVSTNGFYRFDNLKRYFPHLRSMTEFLTSHAYLGALQVTFQGEEDDLYALEPKHLLSAMNGLLNEIECEIRKNTVEYRGSGEFTAHGVAKLFHDKVVKLRRDNERGDGDEAFVGDRDWYVFNANYGTSEEKAFVRLFERQIDRLREKYTGIYLVRNERHVAIYNFKNGQSFEPDYILFLVEDAGKSTTYQIFIEPKGQHLREHDRWKQDFLNEITERFRDRALVFAEGREQRLVGLPFYGSDDESAFRDALLRNA